MHFTSPAALWLLVLLAVPLLLTHRRRPMARQVVSNQYLWRAAVGRSSGALAFRRARRNWLVALQLACIAAIVLTLSGPVVTLGGGRTVLVLDVSASMSARDDGVLRLDAARAHARALVGGLPLSSRVRLILAAASPRDLGEWAASDPRLLSALDAVPPTAGSADVPAALDIAAYHNGVGNVVVFSDSAPVTRPGTGPGRPAVQWVRVGRVAANAAVVRVAARPTRLGGSSGQVLVVVRNYGTEPREADAEISVDGRLAHQAHVRLPPGGAQTLTVTLPNLGRLVTARLLGGDALSLDDTRSAAVPLVDTIRVALVGPRNSFLERALTVNPSVSLRSYDGGASPAEIEAATSRGDYDVLVCDGCAGSVPANIPALVVATTSGQRVRGPLTLVSATHPVAAALEPEPQTATVVRSTAADDGAEVILRVGGVAAVTATDRDTHRTVDVHLDLSQQDFVLTPAFPLLVANALEWLAAQREIPTETAAGESLRFAALAAPGQVRVVGPDGRSRDVEDVGGQYIVRDTDAVGPYRVSSNGAERLVIVNAVVEGESNLSADTSVPFNLVEATPSVSANEPIAVGGWLALMALVLVGLEWRLRLTGAS